jgi:hypothetical protein
LFDENARDFAVSGIGARIAPVMFRLGILVLGCALMSACLVTDQVELDPVPSTPPIVLAADIPLGSVIRVNTNQVNQVVIPLRIRDDNTQEILKPRFRITSGGKTGTYACPELPIPATGALIREDYQIVIDRTLLDKGACSEVDFVVSSTFLSCDRHPGLFDVTVDDNDNLGRATFWIWETSTNPITDPMASRVLVGTCPAIDFTTQTSTVNGP